MVVFNAMGHAEEIQNIEPAVPPDEVERSCELEGRGKAELARVDFALLRDIYEEVVRRSGEDPQKMHFCGSETISIVVDKDMDAGEYSPDSKMLAVNVGHGSF